MIISIDKQPMLASAINQCAPWVQQALQWAHGLLCVFYMALLPQYNFTNRAKLSYSCKNPFTYSLRRRRHSITVAIHPLPFAVSIVRHIFFKILSI